ncbi:MAG: O-antigen ligase family protein, partial [Candidatus Falkowbacteria bacterium]|nr:O-antigen ligase family protein [Candidatus Falkowbacteria bacterium]
MNILVALYVILFIVLTKIRFELALLVLVIALPSYLIKFSLFGIPATILEAMILVVFASWLIDNWKEQWNYLKLACSKNGQSLKVSYPFSREIIALLIFSFISVGIAGFSLQSLGLWKAYFFEPILLFIVLINIYGKKNYKIEGLVNALAVSAICVGGFAIIQKYTNIGWSAEWIAQNRVTSIYSYPNAIGLYLGPIILILVGQLVGHFKQGVKFKDNLIRSAGYSTTIIISLVAIILAKSDGAMLGVSVGLLFFGLFVNKQVRWVILSFIILGSISLYSLQANNQAIAQKLRLQDLSGSIRLIIWNETALLLKDNH